MQKRSDCTHVYKSPTISDYQHVLALTRSLVYPDNSCISLRAFVFPSMNLHVCSKRGTHEWSVPKKLRIEYQKSHAFRVVHADGAYGGTSPRLQLFIAFYSERFPIPKVVTYEASATGQPIHQIDEESESKDGVIREVEVGVTMDLNAAKGFAAWITEQVAQLEQRRAQLLSDKTKVTDKDDK